MEVVIVPENDEKIFLELSKLWFQLIRITIGSIAEKLEQPR